MSESFNPYHEWLGIPDDKRAPNHYELLGIPLFEEVPRVIENAADRQMAHLRTFQGGSRAAHSQRLLNEVAAARICLLKPATKSRYDADLRRLLTPAATLVESAVTHEGDAASVDPLLESRKNQPRRPIREQRSIVMQLLGIAAVATAGAGTLVYFGADLGKSAPSANNPSTQHAVAESPIEERRLESSVKADSSLPSDSRSIADPVASTSEQAIAEPEPVTEASPSSDVAETPNRPGSPDQNVIASAESVQEQFDRAQSSADFSSVAMRAMEVLEFASVEGNEEIGNRLRSLALVAARKSGDNDLIKKVTRLLLEVQKTSGAPK